MVNEGEDDGDVAVPHNIGTLTADHVILYMVSTLCNTSTRI